MNQEHHNILTKALEVWERPETTHVKKVYFGTDGKGHTDYTCMCFTGAVLLALELTSRDICNETWKSTIDSLDKPITSKSWISREIFNVNDEAKDKATVAAWVRERMSH